MELFRTTTSGENSSISTADYNIPTVGGSLEVGKRFDFADRRFFFEPQAQLAGVWENGMDYTASNGLRVHGDDQTSLQGRLGERLGMHFDLSQGRAVVPYAKAEVIEEFLTGNTIRTDSTGFDNHLSGTVGRFLGAILRSDSVNLYTFTASTTTRQGTIFKSRGRRARASDGNGRSECSYRFSASL